MVNLQGCSHNVLDTFDCANRDKLYQELIQAKEPLKVQREELLERATVNSLTGLLNRRELDNRTSKALSQAWCSKLLVAVQWRYKTILF
jgi:PleD family two-component response regulator